MSRCGSLMRAFSQTSSGLLGVASAAAARFPAPCQEPRPVTCWSGLPAGSRAELARRGQGVGSDAAEAVDLGLEAGALVPVADAEALFGGEGEHADLALVGVAVHVAGGLADLLHRVDLGQRRVDQAAVDEPVGLPRLLVVGEVAADDPLEVHPQVAVVVGVHVAAGRGAGDDRAALLGDVDAGAEGLPAGVFEDDVDVVAAGQLADLLAEPLPLLGVLGGLVLPEPVALGGAVDDQL